MSHSGNGAAETTRVAPAGAVRPRGGQAPRLSEIDILRIVAALAVVLYHYTFSGFAGGVTPVAFPATSEITRYGYLGVDLFFVISGFVVLLSAWGRRPEQFVISRIVRLYPAFWVAVTVTAVVSVTLGQGRFPVSLPQYLANLTMFNSLPDIRNIDIVYWTLWAELRFYLLVFVLACFGITRRRVISVLLLWLGATFLLQTGVLPRGPHDVLDLVVQSQFSHYFIAGMALCLIYRDGPSWTLGAILTVCLGNAICRGIQFADDVALRYHAELDPVVIVGVIVTIFVVLTLIALRVTRRLARPWFTTLGTLTYPLYLVHAHIGFVIFDRLGGGVNPYLLLGGTVTAMCLLAYALHALVERPFSPVLKRALTRTAATVRARLSR